MQARELEAYRLAEELIRSGLRLSLVAHLTKISNRWLRQAHIHIFGVSPKAGRLPDSCLLFAGNYVDSARMAAFASLHLRLHGSSAASGQELLETWREYQRLCGPIDINIGYYVCRDVRVGIVRMVRCTNCRADHLYGGKWRYTLRCPYCTPIKRCAPR